MSKAIEVFQTLEKGIKQINKAADIYTLHIVAKLRGKEPDEKLIEEILNKENFISVFNIIDMVYKKEEFQIFEDKEYVTAIGQQILLATYTALEVYLINKFEEYYRYILRDKDADFVGNTIKRFSFRSLKEITKHYKEILKIYLQHFDIEIYSQTKSTFQPEDSWDALNIISRARNEIAHKGKSESYKILTLMDSWHPFDFVSEWVRRFDFNFNAYIYENREYKLIKEYKERLSKIKS